MNGAPEAPESIIALVSLLSNPESIVNYASRYLAKQENSSELDVARTRFKQAFSQEMVSQIDERAFEEKQRLIEGTRNSIQPGQCFDNVNLGKIFISYACMLMKLGVVMILGTSYLFLCDVSYLSHNHSICLIPITYLL